MMSAKYSSEYTNRIVLVCMARHVMDMNNDESTTLPIQGGVIVNYVWERMREAGVRFRAIAAFQKGIRIPVPKELQYGY